MKSLIPIFSLLLLLGSSVASADTVTQEQERLERYEQSLDNRTSEFEDVENDLFGLEAKLVDARQTVVGATSDLEAARARHSAAAIKLAGDDSDDHKRAVRLTSHALKMSERGLRTRSKRLERLEANEQALQLSKVQLQAQLVKDEKNIAKQQARIVAAKKSAAQQVVRLEKAEKAKRAAKAEQHESAVLKAQRLANKEPPKQVVAVEEPAPVKLSELDLEVLAFARKEVQRLDELLASGKGGRPIFNRLVLRGDQIEGNEFEFLGRKQYRAEAVVSKGRQLFEVAGHKYRRTIPATDDGQAYVFILDAKRPSRPRLVMYKKSLIEN
jgi:hypothetical protein